MKGIRLAMTLSLMMWVVIYLSACAVHFGVDWNGETAKDFRTFSSKDKK